MLAEAHQPFLAKQALVTLIPELERIALKESPRSIRCGRGMLDIAGRSPGSAQ